MLPIPDLTQASAVQPQAIGAPQPAAVRALAEQFESLLLAQMLREMRESVLSDEETGLGTGPLGDTVFAELSLALSRAGGVGLTSTLSSSIERLTGAAAQLPAQAMTPALPANTVTAAPAALADPGFLIPAGRLSSGFGLRRDPLNGAETFHKGLDVAIAHGTPVPAARPGVVSFVGALGGYGTTVMVRHDNGVETRYAHLSAATVSPGDRVDQGDTLGRAGSSGRATGPHLHFEVLVDGRAVDPATALGPGAGPDAGH